MSTRNILSKLKEFKKNIELEEISELDVNCKSIIQEFLDTSPTDPNSMIKIDAVIDYIHERINIGNWKEVPAYLRKTMTIASYLKVFSTIKQQESQMLTETLLKEFYHIIDFGLLFGCPLGSKPNLLQDSASILNSFYSEIFSAEDSAPCTSQHSNSKHPVTNSIQIEVLDCPSMEYFYKNHVQSEKPAILTNCINHWPALTKWKDQNYMLKLAGLRTVPIELGSKYTDTEWTQKLMTVEDFIKDHIFHPNKTTGYLAQYQLFNHIPELKNDIAEPEYCFLSDSEQDNPVDINAWFGPKGTVSPLHHDPKNNLLAQVVGEKLIFLFSPADSEFLYPHEHELLSNTARVDPRLPDFVKYPNYKEAKVYSCVLKPGQMLYIPPKWWHFVESLSISFSISFWWM